MVIKNVYSIRISKNDDDIKSYLKQFPLSKQNRAIKSLLKYGIARWQEDYEKDKNIILLQEKLNQLQKTLDQMLEEQKDVKKLVYNLQDSTTHQE